VSHSTAPRWARFLASDLSKCDVVLDVKILPNRMRVKYITNIIETYHFNKLRQYLRKPAATFYLDQSEAILRQIIPLTPVYEANPLSDEPTRIKCHAKINKNEFQSASFIEKRVAVHSLINHVIKHLSEPYDYLHNVLEKSYNNTIKCNRNKFISKNTFNFFPSPVRDPYWRRLIEYYFICDKVANKWSLYVAARQMIRKNNCVYSTGEILRRSQWVEQHRMFNPIAYAVVLDSLSLNGSVIDLHPDRGHKAIACAMLGLTYITPKTDVIDRALQRGLLNLTGLDHHYLSTTDKASLLICDHNFKRLSISDAKEHAHLANNMLAFVHSNDRLNAVAKYNPHHSLKVRVKPTRQKPDYLLVW